MGATGRRHRLPANKLGLRVQPEEIGALQAYLDQTPVIQGITGFATDLDSVQVS